MCSPYMTANFPTHLQFAPIDLKSPLSRTFGLSNKFFYYEGQPMMVETVPRIESSILIGMASSNFGIIQRQMKHLTHEDSLLQLPFRGNCLNWVLGHITQSRNKMLRLVDEDSLWSQEQNTRYDTNSAPITNGDDALRIERILETFAAAHQRLTERLAEMSAEDLATPAKPVIEGFPPMTTGQFLHSLLWHETYHVGQTEILRQLAGKNDKII